MDKKNNYKIYKYTSPSGGVYIGQTKHNIDRRAHKDGSAYLIIDKVTGKYLQPAIAKAIIKYGWDNFKKEILLENLTAEEADEKEVELISYYKSIGECYNIAYGGKGVSGTNSTKVKVYKLNGDFYGEYDSILEAAENFGMDYNLVQGNICACCQGNRNRAYGYIWRYADSSLEVKPLKRYRESICQFDKDSGVYIATYKNIRHAHNETLIGETSIGNVLNGWSKSAGGYFWKFEGDVTEEEKNRKKVAELF